MDHVSSNKTSFEWKPWTKGPLSSRYVEWQDWFSAKIHYARSSGCNLNNNKMMLNKFAVGNTYWATLVTQCLWSFWATHQGLLAWACPACFLWISWSCDHVQGAGGSELLLALVGMPISEWEASRWLVFFSLNHCGLTTSGNHLPLPP